MPWNLIIGDHVIVGDHATFYSLTAIHIGDRSVISQMCYLCTGTHNYQSLNFELVCKPIHIGMDCWLAMDVFVNPGVTIGDRSVVGARSSVFCDIPADIIAVGTPARYLKPRKITD